MSKSSARKSSGAARTATSTRRRQLRVVFGARGREIAGVLLLALAILSFLSLTFLTTGSLVNWWSGALYWLFGWGAFAAVLLIALGGVLLIQLGRGAVLHVPWQSIIGLEIAFFALLGALHALAANPKAWETFQRGEGGGLFGWALVTMLAGIDRGLLGALFGVVGVAALTWGLAIPLGEWLNRLVINLRARLTRPSIDQPARSDSAAPIEISTSEEEIVPPKDVSPKTLPVTATQLPLKIVKTEEKPRKIKRPRYLPGLDLLEEHTLASITEGEIERKSRVIEETLRQFGLEASVVRVSQGPAVTQFGVEPGYIERAQSDGEVKRVKVRVAQITSLANDLALALAAPTLRIEAPVPGESFVGIEVPNDQIAMVGLRGVLTSNAFQKLNSPLAFALGRDVSGAAIAADLGAMPHILIAGTTGSGKSVCINAIIMSLIANNTPEDLRLVMIDPKMVELIRYNGLPHLYGKVETELEQVVGVLRWVTREMDRRYKEFAALGVRHIGEYNQQMLDTGGDKLPYLAVMIDELSDLMLSAPVEIEKTICRIAQMARATGIHLVIATQRPSTDVVTGLIKANFPARIAFSVASGMDSRVILDSVGAETLLGKGDMLFLSPTANGPIRVQGCYVSEREIDRVVGFWREAYADEAAEPAPWAQTRVERLEEIAQASPTTAALEDDDEVLLAKAIEVVKKQRSASASLLQRKLNLGFPKAANLLDRLEEMGVVGPEQKAGRTRMVLIGGADDENPEDWG